MRPVLWVTLAAPLLASAASPFAGDAVCAQCHRERAGANGANQRDGKRVYELTDAGRAEVAARSARIEILSRRLTAVEIARCQLCQCRSPGCVPTHRRNRNSASSHRISCT